MFDLTFTVEDKGALTPLTLAIDQAVIAGWTGRDPVARDKHIAELEAIGIARPATTPIYYRCSARRITMADRIEVCGGNSSGEVEFVLIGWQGRIFVGCGSDHTDRKVEAYSVTVSKQMCDKPMASVLWELEDVIAPLGPDDPALLGRHRRRAGAVPGGHARCHAAGEGPDRRAVSAARACPTAARCSAAPLPPRAASARPTGSNMSWRIPC